MLPGIGETGTEMPSRPAGPAIPLPEVTRTPSQPNIELGRSLSVGDTGPNYVDVEGDVSLPLRQPPVGLLAEKAGEGRPQGDLYQSEQPPLGPAIPMGMDQATAERGILAGQTGVRKLTPEEIIREQQRARERMILTGQEGEQGLPFGEQTRYSTIAPPNALKGLRKAIGEVFPSLKGVDAIDLLYLISRGTTSRMAAQNPTGGVIKYLHDVYLASGRDARETQLFEMAKPVEKFAKSERGKQWIDRAGASRTWDMSGLTPEETIAATAWKDLIEGTRNYANKKGVYVHEIGDDGKMTYRPGKLLPGWTPTTPGDHVYQAAMHDAEKWKQLQDHFITNWKKKFGPGSEAMAREAMDKLVPTLDRNKQQGEPIFSPVVMPKGVDLPDSWKSESRWNDLTRYIKRYSQHMAWAEYVQNTKEGRAAFGLTEDAMGRKDAKPTKWTDVPDAWRGAVREGRKAYASWAREADPDSPPDIPIERFYNPKLVDALMMSYRQGSAADPTMQALNQLASGGLMGTFSGMRDATMGATTAAVYGDVLNTTKSALEYIAGGRGEKLAGARRAGAMGPDVIAPEAVEDGRKIAKGIMSAARFARAVTGRQEFDLFGKTLIFDVIHSLPEAKQQALLEEFGPIEKMDPEEAMALTAARISRRTSNTSTAENLPPAMLPQANTFRSKYLGLMRWSLGQYNNFKEDIVRPAFEGKSKESLARFLKLTVGTAISASLLQTLINGLMDRKPDNLTWGELFNLMGDKDVPIGKKIDEFAYTALANMQLAGAYGWVGDLGLAAVREKAGGSRMSSPIDAQYPLLIMGLSTGKTMMSYLSAVKNGRAGMSDLWQLLQELMGASQNGKILNRMLEVTGVEDKEIKKPVREAQVVERVFGVNPRTGREVGPEAGIKANAAQDPFSASKQALRIPESEYLGRLGGFLQKYREASGQPFTLNRWRQWPDYYEQLGRITGKKDAAKAEEEAAVLDEIVREKNRALREASIE